MYPIEVLQSNGYLWMRIQFNLFHENVHTNNLKGVQTYHFGMGSSKASGPKSVVK